MTKKKIFEGASTALITPFKKGKIDYTSIDKIIEMQIAGGISALVVGGTTGEAATLTDKERYELYTYVKDKVRGRAKIVFGTGTNDTENAIRLTKMATRVGCDGVLIVTPYYNKGTYSGVVRHYKKIAASTDVPIILYNVPSRTGVNLTLKQLKELSKIENIVAIKEASDSVDRLTELASLGDELYIYAGNDSQIYSTLALGGLGVISVVSNLLPENISMICKNYFEGRGDLALREQLRLFDFIRLMFAETNPSPIKYAMSLAALSLAEVRLPLAVPERKTREAIKRAIAKL